MMKKKWYITFKAYFFLVVRNDKCPRPQIVRKRKKIVRKKNEFFFQHDFFFVLT